MRLGLFLIIVFPLLFVSCVKDEEAMVKPENQVEKLKKPGKFRPFKGKLVSLPAGGADLDCDCNGVPPMYLSGTGNVTHMGKVNTEGVSCSVQQPYGFSVDGCVSLIAANGDEVFSDIDPYDLFINTDCFCEANGQTQGQIVGGTGRFEDATGQVDITVHLDMETFEFTVTLDGQISY